MFNKMTDFKEYEIEITEILERTEKVKAKTLEEALLIVEKMYNEEDIILDWSDSNGNVIIKEKGDDFSELINSLTEYMIDDERKHYEESNKPENHIYLTLLQLQNYM